MLRMLRILTASIFLVAIGTAAANAQSVCANITQGAVLTAGQWNSCFQAKQDSLGFSPINQAGGTMTGRLVTAPSTVNHAGFGIPLGIAPSAPVDGDMWLTTSGIFVQVNGATVGPLASSASFSLIIGTTPISGGTSNGLIYNNAGKLSNLATANNGVLVTNGSGAPSVSSTLPSSLTIPSATASNAVLSGTPTMPGLATATCANGVALDASNNVIKMACANLVQVGSTTVTSATGTNYLLSTGTVSGGTGTLGNVAQGYGNSISGGTLNVGLTSLTNSLSANTVMNNTATMFLGPNVAQGTTGTWLATGTVTVQDTSVSATINCILSDSVTIVASTRATTPSAGTYAAVALSGVFVNPAANIRISCQDVSSTSGLITANNSGNGKESTITAIRIQ